ncbi:Site-specific DNA recombinase [Pseudomonas marginalis]|uniref:recombinase family protein n=1 Tax=Pseudomonas marginalis TaxID=298 RepID=UPI00089CA1BD|nr:recombinase family protein [Pseudomonas marginalis]SEC54877.1 Site-specific DNA recombinase [Pseudomonas marginalis]
MNKAYSYIRFSTGKQLKGSSEERQQAMLDNWERDNPTFTLNRDLTFKDLGISGRSGKHLKNGFGKLLEAIEKGAIGVGDVVLVEAIDRAGRMEPGIMIRVLTDILNAGVALVTLDDGQKYTQEALRGGSLYILVGKVQAAFNYSQSLSDRMKASYKSRNVLAANGVIPKRYTPVWLTSEGELLGEIAPFIKQAFEDYAAGLGERRIYERILEAGGDKHDCFIKMAPSTVKRWMKNKTAIGEWQGIPNVYPRVVEPDLFYRVQKRLSEGYVQRAAPTKHKYTGLVVCGECGKNFNTKSYKNKANPPPPVMECSSRARRGSTACPNSKGIPEAVIGVAFQLSCWDHISKALQGQVLTESMKREVVIDGLLSELSVKIAKVARAVAEVDDVEELIVALRALKAEKLSLEGEKKALSHEQATVKEKILNSAEIMKDPMKANALLQSVGYRIVCNLDRTIHTPVGVFTYQGWGRAEDVHKVVTHEGVLLKLPVARQTQTPRKRDSVRVDVMSVLEGKVFKATLETPLGHAQLQHCRSNEG